jgi:hypothetical protein
MMLEGLLELEREEGSAFHPELQGAVAISKKAALQPDQDIV